MSNKIDNGKYLTNIIDENKSLLAAMGVFATIAGFFLLRIDTGNLIIKDIPSLINTLYLIISCFSYFVVVLLSREVIKNLLPHQNTNIEFKLFVYMLIGITISLNLLVILTALDIFLKATLLQRICAVFVLLLILSFPTIYRKIDSLLGKNP